MLAWRSADARHSDKSLMELGGVRHVSGEPGGRFQRSCLGRTFMGDVGGHRAVRVDVGPETEIPDDRAKCVKVDGKIYALFKVGGKVYSLSNQCTHLGGPLCQGSLDGFVVQCPWHGSKFDVRSGQVVGPPARANVSSYAAGIEGGTVWVEIP